MRSGNFNPCLAMVQDLVVRAALRILTAGLSTTVTQFWTNIGVVIT